MVVQQDQRAIWVIDPKHSRIEFAAINLTFTTIKGHFTGVSGAIRGDPADPAHSSIEVEIDTASLDSSEGPRDPYLLEMSVPSIFAAGDVRHGSIKRVASGVGGGAMAVAIVHQYLATR